MISERTTLIRLVALWLALAPLPTAFAYSETDLATLNKTGSCAGCDLTGADLYEADLYQADLSGADLTDADLTAADLSLADLRGADLRGAVLEETNLSGANLTNALLDQSALAGAVFDSERTRTTLGFKELKLGMNVVEIAQYCSITNIEGKASDLASLITAPIERLQGHCFDDADMRLAFGFSGRGSTGVLNWLEVGIAAYTEENHRKFIDLLEQKYKPTRSYSVADVAAFNKDRSLEGQGLDTIFANGQVTLSVVSRGTGLQLLLSYRAEDNGQRFLDRKGGPAPVDLAQLPAVAMDLYKLVGHYRLKGIGAKGTSANHGRIDTAYLEIDAFENELAGELAISGTGMSRRFRITRVEEVSSSRLIFELEPVEGSIPDGRPLRMSLEFAEDGNSFTGKWTNWFRLQNAKSRKPDDFKGVRSQSFWQTAMSHNRIDMYQAYLRLYPGGIYSAVARSRITELGGTLVTPSAPTVSSAIPTEPSTPATATEPVDALAGIWKFSPSDGVGWGYLIVGINNEGELAGFQWQFVHSETFGFRETTITPLADGSYSWRSDKAISLANPSFPINDAVKEGKFWFNESASGLPTITSSKELFAQWPGLPPRQPLEKLSYEEAVALKLPPEVPQDFPSPFVTESQQVASVSEATAATPATPSAATVTTAPVDPLVGIWVRSLEAFSYDHCYLAVGQQNDGRLVGKSWGAHLLSGSNVFSQRDLTIQQDSETAYFWEADKPKHNPEAYVPPDKSGKITRREADLKQFKTNARICVKLRSASKHSTFRKLTLEEALALELPPELLEGFPSPFATEGSQVASTSATSSAATVTTAPVDPLVGVWHWQGGFWGYADSCYLAVGMNNEGELVGKSWETHQKLHLDQAFAAEDIIGSNVVGVRDITIGQADGNSYTWETSETLPLPMEPWTKGAMKGRLYLNMEGGNAESLNVTNRICRKLRSEPKNSRLKKLSLEEALALELPPELSEGFPSPFVTEGQQVASVPKETPSTSATTAPVDPLVGVWLRYEPDLFGNACRLIVGQHDDGNLVGQVWEEAPKVRAEFDTQNLETIDGHKVAVTKIAFQRDGSLRYRWHLEESVFKPTNAFRGASKEGSISILDRKKGEYLFSTNALMCRQRRVTPPMSTFRKLTKDEALAMHLHPAILEGFPSPFQEGTQWSGDLATEVTGAAQTTDAPEDSSDADRR